MQNKWDEKWDEVSAQQRREQEILEEMEDNYRAKQRSFEERYNHLEEYRQQLQYGIDEHYEETMAMLHQHSDNPYFEEAYQGLVDLTEMAIQMNQDAFFMHQQKLIDEEDAFEQNYRKKHEEQEDKVEALRWELIKIDLAEKEERGRK
ncbi:hypothetical protein [Streptococcus macacae]|uniref:Uncharacterized protein n=1 Tax=Streptococcus macacae NCTC 11558 TaxID=764298 RepID=G5JWV6_9STRE|nr:hypothetical protein [Streptococcus macacae]EHJ53039.1 hypothetical protein STRMA_1253 [Streptococcus macacae NCTC 11558]SUN79130.1 Uncharacterised protein [Streptococcus macacae NCTC 11558]